MYLDSKFAAIFLLVGVLAAYYIVIQNTEGATVLIQDNVTLYPSAAKLAKTGGTTTIDNGFISAKVGAKDCGFGTCSSSNSWNAGLKASSSTKATIELRFNYSLAGTDVNSSTIRNLTFNFGGCWHGGGGESCGDVSNIDFKSGGSATVGIWNGSAWETIGSTISLGTSSSSSLDGYKEFTRTKISGFSPNHISNGKIMMRIKTTGTTTADNNVIEVVDYASLNVGYSVLKNVDTNAAPVADAGGDQSVKEGTVVTLNASKSFDPDGDALSFNWTQLSGPSVILQNSNQQVSKFTSPQVNVSATLVFRVNVTDQNSYSLDSTNVLVKNTTLTQPNVILIITDDQRWDTMQYMPTVMTRIVGEGAMFTNAFVSYSLCCPSRATFLTGQYAHNHNVKHNSPPLGSMSKFNDTSSLGTWMQAQGYRTGLIGKYMNGYAHLLPYVPRGWDTWNALNEVYFYNYTIVENGKIIKYKDRPEDYVTDVLRDRAITFMQNDTGQPFFLYLALPAPHVDITWRFPLIAPRHIGTCVDMPLLRPPNYNETNMTDKPYFYTNYLKPLTNSEMVYLDKLWDDRVCSLKANDEAVAAILDTLGPDIDNTLIIFISDNGFSLGEHRREGKFELWDENIHVPLAIRYPPLINGPQVRNELISNIDIAPTISDIANAPPTPYIKVDGRSLTELFTSGNSSWRTYMLIEQWRHGNQTGLRTYDYKYIESPYTDGITYYELYDLKKDPYELDNLASYSAYAAIKNQLHQILMNLKDD